jgi:hypothetical protein
VAVGRVVGVREMGGDLVAGRDSPANRGGVVWGSLGALGMVGMRGCDPEAAGCKEEAGEEEGGSCDLASPGNATAALGTGVRVVRGALDAFKV